MSNSAQVETLQDVIVGKNKLMKSRRGTIEKLKAHLMDRLTLKPSDTQRNLDRGWKTNFVYISDKTNKTLKNAITTAKFAYDLKILYKSLKILT